MHLHADWNCSTTHASHLGAPLLLHSNFVHGLYQESLFVVPQVQAADLMYLACARSSALVAVCRRSEVRVIKPAAGTACCKTQPRGERPEVSLQGFCVGVRLLDCICRLTLLGLSGHTRLRQ